MGKRWTVPYKKAVLEYARLFGKNAESYREFGVSRYLHSGLAPPLTRYRRHRKRVSIETCQTFGKCMLLEVIRHEDHGNKRLLCSCRSWIYLFPEQRTGK